MNPVDRYHTLRRAVEARLDARRFERAGCYTLARLRERDCQALKRMLKDG